MGRRHGGVNLRRRETLVPHLGFSIMGTGTPAMSAFTTWMCLRMCGVTFLRESFCRRETSLDPGLFCQAVYGPEHRLGAKVTGAPAGEEPHLAQAGSQSNRALVQPVFLMEAPSPLGHIRTQKDARGGLRAWRGEPVA
jgi:hypothetical protein